MGFPKYVPKSGKNAGKRNRKNIEDFIKKNNNNVSGVDIAKALNLSLPTVYKHLKSIYYGI